MPCRITTISLIGFLRKELYRLELALQVKGNEKFFPSPKHRTYVYILTKMPYKIVSLLTLQTAFDALYTYRPPFQSQDCMGEHMQQQALNFTVVGM